MTYNQSRHGLSGDPRRSPVYQPPAPKAVEYHESQMLGCAVLGAAALVSVALTAAVVWGWIR